MPLHCHPLAILAFVTFGLVATAGFGEEPPVRVIAWQSDVAAAWTASQSQGQPILLYVKTDSCLYCTKMERETYANQQVTRRICDGFVATAVHSRSIPDLVKKLGIRIYPTTVIIGPDAQVLDSISGYVAADDLDSRLEAAAKKVDSQRR